jgi:hypothetical protein
LRRRPDSNRRESGEILPTSDRAASRGEKVLEEKVFEEKVLEEKKLQENVL